jgi:hypothetical protein
VSQFDDEQHATRIVNGVASATIVLPAPGPGRYYVIYSIVAGSFGGTATDLAIVLDLGLPSTCSYGNSGYPTGGNKGFVYNHSKGIPAEVNKLITISIQSTGATGTSILLTYSIRSTSRLSNGEIV